MEGLTRLVSESMARHGFDRPLDYRRLHWSRWFRCESHHSLLFVPSKPGVFALAEEIMGLRDAHVAADAFVRPQKRSEAESNPMDDQIETHVGTAALGCPAEQSSAAPIAAKGISDAKDRDPSRCRMLAVTQFFEDDDMAFVLDRMLSRQNPMQVRLISGRYFVRFVVIEDRSQRRTICNALNQWMVTASEKATGIGSHFATSLELTPATEYVPPVSDDHVGRTLLSANADTTEGVARAPSPASVSQLTAPQLDSGAARNTHGPSPLPSGF